MGSSKPNTWSGPLVAIGLLVLIVFWSLAEVQGPDANFFVQWMWLVGVALILSGLVRGAVSALDFLAPWWLAFVFVVCAALGAGILPDAAVRPFELGGRLPWWAARILVTLVLQGVATLIWLFTRGPRSYYTERVAVAANSTFLVEIGLIALILVNVLSAAHLARAIGTFDATETGLYSLSDRTRSLLDSLVDGDRTVHAVYLDYDSYPDERPRDLLEQYADYTTHLELKVFNAFRDKREAFDYLRQLGLKKLEFGSEDTVVFVYEAPNSIEPNRQDVLVRPGSFIEESQLGPSKFKGEEQFTGALQNVLLEKKTVRLLVGHDEVPRFGRGGRSLESALDLLRGLSLDIQDLNLAGRSAVPEDTDLLIVAGPRRAIPRTEADAIIDYLQSGGSLILMVDPQRDLLEQGGRVISTGLERYLKGLGVEMKTDFVCVDWEILASRTTGRYSPTENVTTTEYGYSGIVEDLRGSKFACLFPAACPVLSVEAEEDDGSDVDDEAEREALVYMPRTGPPAGGPPPRTYAAKLHPERRPFEPDPATDLMDQRISVAVAVKKPLDDEREMRVVVFGDSDFATDLGLNPGSPLFGVGNETLLGGAASWAVAREELITIEPKTLERERVDLVPIERRAAKVFPLITLPALVLLLALMVAFVRRR